MITAELSYNPYLREMAIKFNGQPPHINSLVEKYQDCPLQDWVAEIPFIFHDEMNGYGFELDFCGSCNLFVMLVYISNNTPAFDLFFGGI